MMLCSEQGHELFEVWYYGSLERIDGQKQKYIVDWHYSPLLIVAKEPHTGQQIVVFDGALHGYDAMFCETYDRHTVPNRPLVKLDAPPTKLFIEVGYSIDYESEKEEYVFNDQGLVELIDGRFIPWEQVKSEGFDYIAISALDAAGHKTEFVSLELA